MLQPIFITLGLF